MGMYGDNDPRRLGHESDIQLVLNKWNWQSRSKATEINGTGNRTTLLPSISKVASELWKSFTGGQ